MLDADKFEGLKEKQIQANEAQYGSEIRENFGDDTVNASHAKRRGMSQVDYNKMIDLEEEILTLLGKACRIGDPSSDLAQEVAAKHKKWLMYSWSDYSKAAHAGLAEMYIADERFTAYYDKHVKGGAAFLRDAILIYTGEVN